MRLITIRSNSRCLPPLIMCAMVGCLLGGCSRAAESEDVPPAKQGDSTEAVAPQDELVHPFARRIPMPALPVGEKWLNSAGPIELKQLRGKFVLIDFWTYCCINCIHILPELKKLEEAYPNQLVVIGVHSAKFETEKDEQNIREAVMRYKIKHPVVVDSEHRIWNFFGIRSWPSLLLIDPQGNAVDLQSGEIKFETYDAVLKKALPYYRKKGLLDETPLRFELESAKTKPTPLRYPGKILADEQSKRLFIADSNHNRIVVTDLDGKLQAIIGSGEVGAADGVYDKATFNQPQGMALVGQTLYVADTENHLLRKIDLIKKSVRTIAGTGKQGRSPFPGLEAYYNTPPTLRKIPDRWVGKPKKTAISSPWALFVHEKNLYIAMAGPHQIWKMPLDESEIGPYAGNAREDIVDGPLLPKQPHALGFSSFAQPSGLASDGKWLYVADSEGSSIRAVPFDSKGKVETVVGSAHLPGGRLFEFGDVDGQGTKVRLQHALGVVYNSGKLYIADTYNNKIKVIDVKARTCRTIAGTGKSGDDNVKAEFDEPAGISYAAGRVYVADTNNHLIRVIDLKNDHKVTTLKIAGLKPYKPASKEQAVDFGRGRQQALKLVSIKSGTDKIRFKARLALPRGWKINPAAPMQYFVVTGDPKKPVEISKVVQRVELKKPSAAFDISIPSDAVSQNGGSFKIKLHYYYCQDGGAGLCKMGSVVWAIPVSFSPSGSDKPSELFHQVPK